MTLGITHLLLLSITPISKSRLSLNWENQFRPRGPRIFIEIILGPASVLNHSLDIKRKPVARDEGVYYIEVARQPT